MKTGYKSRGSQPQVSGLLQTKANAGLILGYSKTRVGLLWVICFTRQKKVPKILINKYFPSSKWSKQKPVSTVKIDQLPSLETKYGSRVKPPKTSPHKPSQK